MHEMSIAEGVIEAVEAAAARERATRVKTVVLEIGRLAAVETEALRFCFEAVARAGIAAGARLEVIDIDATGWCMPCARTVPMQETLSACPECGSFQVQPVTGTEMRIKEIEIE